MPKSNRSVSRSRSRTPDQSTKKYSRSPPKLDSPKRSKYNGDENASKDKVQNGSPPRSPPPKRTRSLSKHNSRSRSKSPPRRSRKDRSRSYSRSPNRNAESKQIARSRSISPKDRRDVNGTRGRRPRSSPRPVHEQTSRRPETDRRERSGSRSHNQWRQNDRESPEESNVLGIFGMSLYTDERMLKDEFRRFGELQKVHLVKDNRQNSRGFAFITFERLEDARKAREEMRDRELDGKLIRIDYSISKTGHAPTPGEGYMGRRTRSPPRGKWDDGGRSGYGFSRRTSGDYRGGLDYDEGRDRSYGGRSRRPPSPQYDDRRDRNYREEYRHRSRTRSPRR